MMDSLGAATTPSPMKQANGITRSIAGTLEPFHLAARRDALFAALAHRWYSLRSTTG